MTMSTYRLVQSVTQLGNQLCSPDGMYMGRVCAHASMDDTVDTQTYYLLMQYI